MTSPSPRRFHIVDGRARPRWGPSLAAPKLGAPDWTNAQADYGTLGTLDCLEPPYHFRARDARRLMSRFFKSAAFPILIVIVLAFFASKLIATHDSTSATSFHTFLNELNRGQVSTVVLHTKDLSVDVTTKGPDARRYTV